MKTVRMSQLTARMVKVATIGAAALVASSAYAGISNTKHNLGSGGPGPNKATSGTDEICVFCHTPHGANTAAVVPLWNKGMNQTNYTTYSQLGTSSLDAESLSIGSVSLACLSCHDGTQAMDNMVNAPGSGGYNATGASAGWNSWTGTNVSAAGLMGTGTNQVAMLGTDLRNDHPIGIAYCGGWTSTGAPSSLTGGSGGACKDTDFRDAVSKTLASGTQVWWVDSTYGGGTANTRDKTDMILYTRNFTGTVNGQALTGGVGPSVECASCHDPHVDSKGTAGAPQVAFLRISQTGSGLCLACHDK